MFSFSTGVPACHAYWEDATTPAAQTRRAVVVLRTLGANFVRQTVLVSIPYTDWDHDSGFP